MIRRGKSGHFYDKGLEGVAHHAVIPNVNVLDDLEPRLGQLCDDEKRLFALVCRSYLAAVMPDYEYRQTVATISVPVPGGPSAEFRATGRIPLRLGLKTAYGALPQEQDGEGEPEQTLPPLTDGEAVTLTDPKVEAKRTQPPPRYSEGTLVEAMQNAWRFVKDAGLRNRLKEAKGIGTPATRADIIKGLKRQNLLAADGKFVVPTSAGLQIFELLRGAAPSLVDPATTATWEMRLDDIVFGRTDFRAVIDGIAGMAEQLIGVLRGHPGNTIDLGLATVTTSRGRRQPRAQRRVGRRGMTHRKAACRDHRQYDDLEEILRAEVADFEFAQTDNAQRRRLDAADPNHTTGARTEQRFRGGSGQRQIEDLVCLLARHRGVIEGPQIAVRLELCEGLAQGLWVLRGKQRALDATAIGEMIEDLLADQLPFAVAVGRQDHLIAVFERCSDGLQFRRLVAVRRRARRIEAVWLEEGA